MKSILNVKIGNSSHQAPPASNFKIQIGNTAALLPQKQTPVDTRIKIGITKAGQYRDESWEDEEMNDGSR